MREYSDEEKALIEGFILDFCNQERAKGHARSDGGFWISFANQMEVGLLGAIGIVRDEEWIIKNLPRGPEDPPYMPRAWREQHEKLMTARLAARKPARKIP